MIYFDPKITMPEITTAVGSLDCKLIKEKNGDIRIAPRGTVPKPPLPLPWTEVAS